MVIELHRRPSGPKTNRKKSGSKQAKLSQVSGTPEAGRPELLTGTHIQEENSRVQPDMLILEAPEGEGKRPAVGCQSSQELK